MIPKRNFAKFQMRPPTGNIANWALIGAGSAGLIYLMLYGRNLSYARYQAAAIPEYKL